ncbi:unnamed protein product [Acanthoscelides obtectus]|uniref:CHHC U11-48K-type domain-containing protein n=1 Tax=Acanthoscelides obtectus TaxID=200917 RepID=A0A9P0LGT9_ACAOB|nr:unnamed protein product [Acanthoscelides obtectus]CAK1649856.1 hypothetical protein AOBTE_LOCUS16461 [Acanthoscelides obtectus]
MNFNVEVRKKQLQSLDQCITSFKDKVDSILGYLGWSAKKVLENDDRTLCPINSGHTVQLESVVPHVERCRLTSQGYSLTEAFLSEPSADPKSSISLNNLEKIEALNKIRSVNPRFVADLIIFYSIRTLNLKEIISFFRYPFLKRLVL